MKIIHVTDPHVRPPGETLYGIDTGARLKAVVDDVNRRHPDADLFVVTGDLTHHGEPAAYAEVKRILANLSVPSRLLLGNHDARPSFREMFPAHPVDDSGFVQSWIDGPGRVGRLIFLDTHEAGRIAGHLCERRLAWLDRTLASAEGRAVTVFQHHPALNVGARHFDHICLMEPAPYLDLLHRHGGGIRHVFFGHIHLPVTGCWPGGITYTAGRGCSHQMVLDLKNGDTPWVAGVANYNVIILEDDQFVVHAFDAIAADEIGMAIAPTGP